MLVWPDLYLPPINLWNAPKMNKVMMFSSETCAPCKQMKAIMENIDHTAVHLEYLDARQEREQVLKYGMRTLPTFVMTDGDGNKIKQYSGVMSPEEYEAWLE